MEDFLLPLLVVLGGVFIWFCFSLTFIFILIRLGTMFYLLKSGKVLSITTFLWQIKNTQLSQPASPSKPNNSRSV